MSNLNRFGPCATCRQNTPPGVFVAQTRTGQPPRPPLNAGEGRFDA